MDDKIRLYMLVTMTVFFIVAAAALYWFYPTAEAENRVKAEYRLILQNYSCTPVTPFMNLPSQWCERNGYYYPSCPNESDNLSQLLYGR